ncbi:MAG: hypothetical protein ACE5FP_06260 [Gemmatimonadota bacterium]
MRLRTLVVVVAVALMFALSSPPPVQAQSSANVVWTQMQSAYTAANLNGYTLRNYVIGRLDPSASDTWTFPLRAGKEYVIVGACDEDCTDVDVTVTQGSAQVASDVTTDDHPVVGFTAGKGGVHEIVIKMYSCDASFCYFGFGLFEN